MKTNHTINLSIGRTSCSHGPDYVRVSLADELSGARIQVKLSLEDYAKVITGLGHIQAEAESYNMDKIGLVREHRQMIMKTTDGWIFEPEPSRKLDIDDAFRRTDEAKDGWEVCGYGFGTKAFAPASHVYYIQRFVPIAKKEVSE